MSSRHCAFGVSCLGIILLVALALTGCTTRSISNSGYSNGYYDRNDFYTGELSEFSILGINPNEAITEEQISAAFDSGKKVELKQGKAVLLIQSGAPFPDEPMQREMSKTFRIVPFSSGADKDASKANLSKALRLAAAQGGCEYVVCYWGVLETAQKDLVTKGVSWVPIVGRAIPDETQQMRIRLKLVIVDVRTSTWTMIAPEPFMDSGASARVNRESADQGQVNALKEMAYTALAEQLRQMAAAP